MRRLIWGFASRTYHIVVNPMQSGQLSLDKLKLNQRSHKNLSIQDFEADFLWKVSLKILNSGKILKAFTQEN